MPMRPRLRATTREPELFGELIDVLVGGWGCPVVEYPKEDPFRVFTFSDADLIDVWERHKVRLTAEARKRGIDRPWIQRWQAWKAAGCPPNEPS